MDRFASILAFVRTAEHRSFAKAAVTLGVHGSAVSKSVARLEEHLGLRLFHRTTRSLSLTEEGRLFQERCVRILAELDDAEHAVAVRNERLLGRLTVSLPVALGRSHIVPALGRLQRNHPRLEILACLLDRQVDPVSEGFDAVVRIGTPQDSSLVGRRLATVRSVVCASDAYLAEMGDPLVPTDLARHRCLTYLPNLGARTATWRFSAAPLGGSYELPVCGPLRVSSAEALLEAAAEGAGLIQIHSYLASAAIASGRLRPVLEPFAAADGPPISVLYPSARQLSAKVRMFVDVMTALFVPVPIWERRPGQDADEEKDEQP